jgi:hypothetical protein
MLSPLTIFGLVSLAAMMLFDTLEDNNPLFSVAFGISCFCGSIYGFMSGAWPFGVVEAFWGVMKLIHFVRANPPIPPKWRSTR